MGFYVPPSEKVGRTRPPCPPPNCAHNCWYASLFHGWPTCLRLGSIRKYLDNSRSTGR